MFVMYPILLDAWILVLVTFGYRPSRFIKQNSKMIENFQFDMLIA